MKLELQDIRLDRLRQIAGILAAFWVILLSASYLWQRHTSLRTGEELALTEARSSYNKDLVYRRWATTHGGVYVPVTTNTPPNPYLDVPHRDVTTSQGQALTLINPAYMTRQVHELGKEQYGTQGHITSLKPIRPGNAPDAWESNALHAFERNLAEVSGIQQMGNERFMRFMKPLKTEKGCLKCHEKQGYREGDIRGGISVSVPMEPFDRLVRIQALEDGFIHGFACLLGLGGIGWMRRRVAVQIQERSANEDRFRLLYENAPVAYQEMDAEGSLLDVNSSWLTMMGYERRQIIGMHFSDCVIRDQKTRCREWIDAIRVSDEALGADFEVCRNDGGILSISAQGKAERDLSNVCKKIYCVLHNTTERRKAEEAIRSSEAKFSMVFRNAPIMIAISRLEDGVFLEVNDIFLKVTGYTREEVVGKGSVELGCVLKEDRLRLMDILRSEGHIRNREISLRTKEGKMIECVYNGEDILLGNSRCLLSTALDISERKKLEAKLWESQKMEAVGQLAGGVAHDFNNILAAFMMQIGFMSQKSDLDSETRELLTDLDKEARRAADLVRQLLMFSRRSVLQSKVLDLNDVVENLLKMLRRLIGEQISICFEVGLRSPRVEADPGMIEQVLMNLAVNARDAMPKGGRITITTSVAHISAGQVAENSSRKEGNFACLSVADTGCGMSPEILNHIFEPFFTTKEVGKGTGLGLATVYGIIAQHKGWVEVESAVAVGSTFKVYLPLVSQSIVKVASDQEIEQLRYGSETILLVEDDAPVRKNVTQLLTHLGYKVLQACDGREALSLWQDHRHEVDLLFTDMVMPLGINGAELAEQLKKTKPGLQVILTSGYNETVSLYNLTSQTQYPYLPKPFSSSELSAVLRQCLDEQK